MEYIHPTSPDYWGRGPESLAYQQPIMRAMGLKHSVFPLGNPDGDEGPAVVIVSWPPGSTLWRHSHTCARIEFIHEGTIESPSGVLTAGTLMTALPGEEYGPYKAGPDGAKTVEILGDRAALSWQFNEHTDPDAVQWFTDLLDSDDPELRDAARIVAEKGGLIPTKG